MFVLVLLPLQPLIWLLGESIPESLGLSSFRTLYLVTVAAELADVPAFGTTMAAAEAVAVAAAAAAAAAAAMGQPALTASEFVWVSSTMLRLRVVIVTAAVAAVNAAVDEDGDASAACEDDDDATIQAAVDGVVRAFINTLLLT